MTLKIRQKSSFFCDLMKGFRLKLELLKKTSICAILFPLLLLFGGVATAEEPFPLPSELRADVDFWIRVFTEVSTDEGVLHDSRNLAVVYGRVDMPAKMSRRERQRRIDAHRKSLQAILRTLASGKRDNLDTEEARILGIWGQDVSNATLSDAVGRIRFQQGLKERFRAGLARSGRWRSYVTREFTALGIPAALAALPHVESSYNPDARSHVGASGIWQFTRSTGRRFMRVDHVVDERNDPFAATRAAGRLLAYNHSITGNWPMAITAYNHGLSGVRRAMQRFGDTAYTDILRNYNGRTFGFASRNFYVAFLAAKTVDESPLVYFPDLVMEEPVDYAVAKLSSYVSAEGLAQALGVREAEIAMHNPGLQATVWQGSKYVPRGYELRLPATAFKGSLADALAGLPPDVMHEEQLPDLFHTVARGDTLSEIAETYGTRVSTLVALNSLGSRHRIRAGQRLRLPAAGPAPPTVETVASVVVDEPAASLEEAMPAVMVEDVEEPSDDTGRIALLSDPSDYSVAEDGTIEVQPLETLGHYGDWLEIKTQRLRDLNGLAFLTPVEVGQRIRLDLGRVDADRFEARRLEYQRAQQDAFFRRHRIADVTEHVIRDGESIWVLAQRQYQVPVWLLRQYNPGLDLHRVRPGTRVQMPVLADAG